MKGIIVVVLTLGIFPGERSLAAPPSDRQSKIEAILRTQDMRTPHDGKLVSLLSDTDAVVRERAVRAYGSIQDTTALSLLVQSLTDPDSAVAASATFAVAQTATQLAKSSRQRLEHDLVWNRLDLLKPASADRLIEEIGKFGTDQALADLLQRYAGVYPRVHTVPLLMCIARCAIRNVVTSEASRYVLQFMTPPETPQWQAMYALQRIGDRPETRADIDRVSRQYQNDDPRVRMHLATLLGKIRDVKSSLPILLKLADFDPDWRVRVNALKALANFNIRGRDDVVGTIRRAFFSDNFYVAVTALSAIGDTRITSSDSSTAVRQAYADLIRVAKNDDHGFEWQLQAEAVTALAKLEGSAAYGVISPASWPQPALQARILEAIGETGAPEALTPLVEFVKSSDQEIRRSALDGLRSLSAKNMRDSAIINETYRQALSGLGSGDVAIVTTSASILGDSLFRRPASVSPLLDALENLRLPYDIEAIQEVATTLGSLGDRRAVDPLLKEMQLSDRSVALACAAALKSITGKDYARSMKEWYQPPMTDYDFDYLRALPETVRVVLSTARGDIRIELYKGIAPFTVMSTLKLARQRGFYHGLTFHRVVPNFVIQGGDPRGDGWGGPDYTLRSEFSSLSYDEGVVGMADAGKDTPGSQFFITQSPQPHLDGRYTVIGRVISGMDVVNSIRVGDRIFDVK